MQNSVPFFNLLQNTTISVCMEIRTLLTVTCIVQWNWMTCDENVNTIELEAYFEYNLNWNLINSRFIASLFSIINFPKIKFIKKLKKKIFVFHFFCIQWLIFIVWTSVFLSYKFYLFLFCFVFFSNVTIYLVFIAIKKKELNVLKYSVKLHRFTVNFLPLFLVFVHGDTARSKRYDH